MPRIPNSTLDVFPLCLGANVFGWTADEAQSFAVLDAFKAGGGNFIDTADVYSAWVPGNQGGESERIIGNWLAARGDRANVVVATKVAKLPSLRGLAAATIRSAAEASLKRLKTDYIDLYYAHEDDPATPIEESLAAFDALIREGKVRAIAASNFSAPRLAEALEVSRKQGLARYVAVQPEYNLVERDSYEGPLAELAQRAELACIPYYALAKGFLTGKYRPGKQVDSVRAQGASSYLDERGLRVLRALDELAAAHHASVTAVALAWLRLQPTVLAPIASARTVAQVDDLLAGAHLQLKPDELESLRLASRS